MYAFCGGDPVNRVDPMGTDWYQGHSDNRISWFDGSIEIEGYRRIGNNHMLYADIVEMSASNWWNHVEFGDFNSLARFNYGFRWSGNSELKSLGNAYFQNRSDATSWLRSGYHGDGSRRLNICSSFGPAGMVADAERTEILVGEGGHGCGICHGTTRDLGASYLEDVGAQQSNKMKAGLISVAGGTPGAFAFSVAAVSNDAKDPWNYIGFLPAAAQVGTKGVQFLQKAKAAVTTGAPFGFSSIEEYQKAWLRMAVDERTTQLASQIPGYAKSEITAAIGGVMSKSVYEKVREG